MGTLMVPTMAPVTAGRADNRETMLEPPFAVDVDSDPGPDCAVVPVCLVRGMLGFPLVSECHLENELRINFCAWIDA